MPQPIELLPEDVELEKLVFPPDWSEDQVCDWLCEHVPRTIKELARYSLALFARYYLGPHFFANLFPAQLEAMEELDQFDGGCRALYLWPRSHGKTTTLNFAFALHCICYQRKRNIVLGSDEAKQAKEFLRNIKTELEANERIIEDFGSLIGRPRFGGKWDETHIITANNVQVIIRTPSMTVRGMNYNARTRYRDETGALRTRTRLYRPDLVILDDILNARTIQNKDQRAKLDKWVFEDMLNAMDVERGDLVVIGTCLHNDDLTMRLWKDEERTGGWIKRRVPACQFDNGQIVDILWPEYWSAAKLLKRQEEIGSLAFAQEFMLRPSDEGSVFFDQDWFRFFNDGSIPPEILHFWREKGTTVHVLPDDLICITAIDPNNKQTETADYTTVMTLGWSPSTRHYYILDCYHGRPSPEGQIMQMIRQKKRWDRELTEDGTGYYHKGFVVETFAYQNSIQYWLKKLAVLHGIHGARVIPKEEHGVDKVLRCSMLSPMVEQNHLFFPLSFRKHYDGDPFIDYPMQWLQDELEEFPTGSYDDGVDALQRCYSVLKAEERKYLPMGDSAPSELDEFHARLISEQSPDSQDIYA